MPISLQPANRTWSLVFCTVVALLLSACGSAPLQKPNESVARAQPSPAKPSGTSRNSPAAPALPAANSGRGGYYQDDGPGDQAPEGLADIPDADPQIEPYAPRGNSPYKVFGKTYTPLVDDQPFTQRGMGSWYGKKFHGQKTSSGERYDMYKMTAAHPTLPIPSYARVTNLANGAQVIVRINDRGPFHSNRVIDLSYTAALKLGYLGKGSAELQIDRLLPKDIEQIAANKAARARGEVVATNPSNSGEASNAVQKQALPAASPNISVNASYTVTPDSSTSDLARADTSGSASGKPMVASTPTAPATVDPSNFVPGYYLQVGAYSEQENAEAARARLMQAWDASVPALQIASVGVFYRLHAGPFESREQASVAARKLMDSLQLKTVIVSR